MPSFRPDATVVPDLEAQLKPFDGLHRVHSGIDELRGEVDAVVARIGSSDARVEPGSGESAQAKQYNREPSSHGSVSLKKRDRGRLVMNLRSRGGMTLKGKMVYRPLRERHLIHLCEERAPRAGAPRDPPFRFIVPPPTPPIHPPSGQHRGRFGQLRGRFGQMGPILPGSRGMRLSGDPPRRAPPQWLPAGAGPSRMGRGPEGLAPPPRTLSFQSPHLGCAPPRIRA